MAYIPLLLSDNTPANLRTLVTEQIEPHLHDVHTMLRLPIDGIEGMDGGCNFAALQVLLNVISGVSVSVSNPTTKGQRGRLFKDEMIRHFPWDAEPTGAVAVVGKDAAEFLYDHLRNPMAHTLGLHNEGSGRAIKITKDECGLSEADVIAIEMARTRPPSWGPTVTAYQDRVLISVKGLYWGVRQMIENAVTERIMRAATLPAMSTNAAIVSSTTRTVTTTMNSLDLHTWSKK